MTSFKKFPRTAKNALNILQNNEKIGFNNAFESFAFEVLKWRRDRVEELQKRIGEMRETCDKEERDNYILCLAFKRRILLEDVLESLR